MRHGQKLAATLALLTPMIAWSASTDPASLSGLWKGTIGRQPVIACFNHGDLGVEGSYYYLKHRVPISIGFDEKARRVREADGSWTVQMAADANSLTGTWNKTNGMGAAPIALTRAATDPAACGSDAFAAPLEASTAPRVVQGPRTDFNGHTYRSLSGLNQATIQIDMTGPAGDAINRDLLGFIDESPSTIDDYNNRRRENLRSRGYVMDDEKDVRPAFWSNRYLTITFYSWAAGTGKSGISSHDITWDLSTGKRVDLWAWVGATHDATSEDVARLPSALLATFITPEAPASTGDSCAPNYSGDVPFRISLTANGLAFEQWATGDGCDTGFSADFSTLLPYMSREGRAAASAIMASNEKVVARP